MSQATPSDPVPRVVAIISPGDMGHAIGRVFREHGIDVIACLRGRSERTRGLAERAGIRDVETLQQLVAEADMVLSILAPHAAESAAEAVAAVIPSTPSETHFVDCNAVSPATVRRIAARIVDAGGRFTDASIIGLPPGTSEPPRIYACGPEVASLRGLDGKGVAVHDLGEQIGRASGIKMCYAALTKGTFALYYALAMAADRMGLLEELVAEFEYSQPEACQRMRRVLPKLPAKAWRWVGEMEEIAATFQELEVTPGFHRAAADVYQAISQTTLGRETPETIDLDRTWEQTIATLSAELAQRRFDC